ncbi:hypothetical protein AB6735_18600 [Mucilaginibacter sp. RCC_168]|uniref:hypothetical protein n=1 Tax=Mucilaginibacter sp. RCC_168 TaxID=3239221 RepID=UPI003524515E
MVIGFHKQFVAPILAGTKIHTLREDKNDRWKPGVMMHQYTGGRFSKEYQKFNETPCVSTQKITMAIEKDLDGGLSVLVMTVGNRELDEATQELLAVRDGFASMIDFKKWWYPILAKQPGFKMVRKIIHWTDLRY